MFLLPKAYANFYYKCLIIQSLRYIIFSRRHIALFLFNYIITFIAVRIKIHIQIYQYNLHLLFKSHVDRIIFLCSIFLNLVTTLSNVIKD